MNPVLLARDFDSLSLRETLSAFLTGVTVVTTHDEGEDVGFTANSFTSVSLDPPLVLVCLANTSRNLQTFLRCAHFTVNVLEHGQLDTARAFASTSNLDRFSGVTGTRGAGDVLALDGSLAVLECEPYDRHPAGDHLILIGRVVGIGRADGVPLGFAFGSFQTLAPEVSLESAAPETPIRIRFILLRPEGEVCLVHGSGGLVLPGFSGTCQDLTAEALAYRAGSEFTIPVRSPQLFSIYDSDDGLELVYRAEVADDGGETPGLPTGWTSLHVDQAAHEPLAGHQTLHLLERFRHELGDRIFGIFTGSHHSGTVQRISEPESADPGLSDTSATTAATNHAQDGTACASH